MINDRYYVKIVPQKGDTVHRFEVRRRHMWFVIGTLSVLVFGSLILAAAQVVRAQITVASLARQSEMQKQALQAIDHQTDDLRLQLQRVQKQNQEIKAAIGIGGSAPRPRAGVQKTSWVRGGSPMARAAARVQELAADSASAQMESDNVKSLAMRVLNMQHLRSLERARLIAAIPSIDPVDGAEVVGCFCWRTYPDVEFHKGVDLGADYGMTVRAAAAGVVVANGYDGAYGIKIDIDHGNGYHTWYAHLSRADVAVGQHVYKGESIGAVGATGFATGPHLHYQVMYDDQPVDPAPYLHGVPPNVLATLP